MEKWNYWTDRKYYQLELKERAKGLKREMEAAKQISQLIFETAISYNSILDAGCGTGHFILSLEKRIRNQFKYFGVDITEQHIKDAKSVFKGKPNYNFTLGDIRSLPVKDKSFDLSICSNTIPHIPNISKAIKELIRVSKNDIFLRMLVGDEILITKKALSNVFDKNGEPESFMYVNIYTEDYLRNIIGEKGEMFIYSDTSNIDNIKKHFEEHKNISGKNIATQIIGGKQFKGYLMLPWKIVHIRLKNEI